MKQRIRIWFSKEESIDTWADYEKLINNLKRELASDWIRFSNLENKQEILVRKDKIRIIELVEND